MGGAGGRLIRWLQLLNGDGFSDYEHVRMLIKVIGENRGLFFEAQPGGAVLAEHELEGDGRRWSSGIIKTTAEERRKMVAVAKGMAEQKVGYSWLTYAALAARRLHIPVPYLRRFIASTKELICSQALARIWWLAGHPLFDRWTGFTTPGDLNQLLDDRTA